MILLPTVVFLAWLAGVLHGATIGRRLEQVKRAQALCVDSMTTRIPKVKSVQFRHFHTSRRTCSNLHSKYTTIHHVWIIGLL